MPSHSNGLLAGTATQRLVRWPGMKGIRRNNSANLINRATILFQQAVILSARGGYTQDAGLASHRLCDFALNVLDDVEEAAYRIKESIRYYNEWNGYGVSAYLRKTYSILLSDHHDENANPRESNSNTSTGPKPMHIRIPTGSSSRLMSGSRNFSGSSSMQFSSTTSFPSAGFTKDADDNS